MHQELACPPHPTTTAAHASRAFADATVSWAEPTCFCRWYCFVHMGPKGTTGRSAGGTPGTSRRTARPCLQVSVNCRFMIYSERLA